jgi:hypothetical protein
MTIVEQNRPWAAATPSLELTWTMTPDGLRMQWIASADRPSVSFLTLLDMTRPEIAPAA